MTFGRLLLSVRVSALNVCLMSENIISSCEVFGSSRVQLLIVSELTSLLVRFFKYMS